MELDCNRLTGRVDQAKWIESKNYDQRPDVDDISSIIIHAISLPPDCYGGEYVEALFTNCLNSNDHPYFVDIADRRVSSHFYIKRNGSLIQFVSTNNRAWHAGESVLQGRTRVNDFSIGIELEGCDSDIFEDDQYKTLTALSRCLIKAYDKVKLENIVGHSDIAPGRKTDPGPGFDWKRFLKSLT